MDGGRVCGNESRHEEDGNYFEDIQAVAQKTGVIAAWMVALLAVVLGVMKA